MFFSGVDGQTQAGVVGRIRSTGFRSYGDLAHALGDVNKSRAVGAANGRNPISIIVPCHRVIGADGTLTGYAGGLERKLALLSLEGAALAPVTGTGAPATRRTRLSAPANLAFDF